MSDQKKYEIYRCMDNQHPEAGWKTIVVEVKPRLVHYIIPDKTSKEGFRIEKRWESK